MREVYNFLHNAGPCFLASFDGVQPHLRPIGSIRLYRDRLCFQTVRTKAVSRELHANPRVELCAVRGSSWLRLDGSAALDDDPAARTGVRALEALYNPDGADTELWYLRNCTAALYNGAEMIQSWRF